MVRVADQTNPEKKTLIKNLKGDVKDIAFAYTRPEVILGCIDSEGNILIYNVHETKDSIMYPFIGSTKYEQLYNLRCNIYY